jgi:hypothetical protein
LKDRACAEVDSPYLEASNEISGYNSESIGELTWEINVMYHGQSLDFYYFFKE